MQSGSEHDVLMVRTVNHQCHCCKCQPRIARSLFVILALLQMIIVVILQALILAYGGHGGPLPEYKHCLSDALQMAINCSEKANWTNVTIPSFGKDKPVYVGFIIALTVYNAVLCIYALWRRHYMEMIAFLIVNVLTTIYAGVETYEFRPFSSNCDVPIAQTLAIGSVTVLSIFTVLFLILMVFTYLDSHEKANDTVNKDKELKKHYWWYEGVSSGVKLVVLFAVVFYVAWLALLLIPNNYEFGLTIILLIVAVVAYFVLQLTMRNNSFIGYVAIAITGLLLMIYYIFKIWRFFSKSCPVCQNLTDSLKNEYKSLQLLLEMCTNNSNVTLDPDIDRSIQFENLAIFGIINVITTFLVMVSYLVFCCYYPGTKTEHLFSRDHIIVKIMKYNLGNRSVCTSIKQCCGTTASPCCSEDLACCVEDAKNEFKEAFYYPSCYK